MKSIFNWLKQNRTPIGYGAGLFCSVNGILDIAFGNYFGAFQFFLGVIILLDVIERGESNANG